MEKRGNYFPRTLCFPGKIGQYPRNYRLELLLFSFAMDLNFCFF